MIFFFSHTNKKERIRGKKRINISVVIIIVHFVDFSTTCILEFQFSIYSGLMCLMHLFETNETYTFYFLGAFYSVLMRLQQCPIVDINYLFSMGYKGIKEYKYKSNITWNRHKKIKRLWGGRWNMEKMRGIVFKTIERNVMHLLNFSFLSMWNWMYRVQRALQ